MVFAFYCNKWITGGDLTKTAETRQSVREEQYHVLKSRRCNESTGHGQMMDVETSYSDFINCDRTGRRNAVPDISGEGAVAASTSELTKDLAGMDLKAAEGEGGGSPAPEAETSTSQDAQGGGGPS